jgi:hypothetical protein
MLALFLTTNTVTATAARTTKTVFVFTLYAPLGVTTMYRTPPRTLRFSTRPPRDSALRSALSLLV